MAIQLKNNNNIEKIKKCGNIISEVHSILGKLVEPGISTWELDKVAEDYTVSKGYVPAFKGYQNFPGSICASINHEVVHGIPSKNRILKKGDIIGIDFGVYKDGFYADSAFTFGVGNIGSDLELLLDVTRDSLAKGIENAVIGNKLYDISKSIQDHVENNGFSIVRSYVGHGIGRNLHEDPQVPNFVLESEKRENSLDLVEGLVIAIEPMVNVGNYEVEVSNDNWTVVTKDGSLSAHFEHTIAITKKGPVNLTK
ncbi:type I methionyl aminopeptidase [bacterium]|jgi:methionyl aminopeptidase|nr:type I methionyl aminopeptidase [bacterium]RZP16154.1 MAG: type I methionyl aminopeptidase [Candidatus Dadabacteria bacterium]|tara:strand:- start:33 stop:794 length:762 start_codon:yes stop_codon:yes gene_type:complete